MSKYILAGVVLFVVILLPVLIIRETRERKRIRRILRSHRDGEGEKSGGHVEQGSAKHKGWGMNNSPFRTRKSGVSWGGGNIKASEAMRGTRRKFL